MLEEILTEGDRVLIFSQFAEMGELLSGYLPKALGCAVQEQRGGLPSWEAKPVLKNQRAVD